MSCSIPSVIKSDTSVRLIDRTSGKIGDIAQVIIVSPFRIFCGCQKVRDTFFENHSSVIAIFPRGEVGFASRRDVSS